MGPAFQPPYALPVPGAVKKEGETVPYRHFKFTDKLTDHPENVFTLWDAYQHGFQAAGDKPFLGTRRFEKATAKEYVWQTYPEVNARIENFSKGLLKLGLTHQESIGVYAINRAEWTMAEIACYKYSFIVVALYDTLGPEAFEYIVDQTHMEYLVLTEDKLENLIELRSQLKSVKTLILMDEIIDQANKEQAEAAGYEVYTFKDVEKLGMDHETDAKMSSPEDIATICYTSGTTGVPKGVVLTHANIIASINGILELSEKGTLSSFSKDDVHISYLPLAHVFERAAQGVFFYLGGSIGYYQGDTNKLLDDIAELKPTVFCSVPRLFNRIYDKVLAGVKAKGGVSAYLFHTAFTAKKNQLNKTVNHWLWDRVVFSAVRQKLGGRVRFILSGSAPVSADVMDFMRICFSAKVYEGYGQTENFCASCLTIADDNTSGVVGVPFPSTEIKLVDVPEMEYLSTDQPYPRGEICVRGNTVMREYYKNPEKTAETIDSEGWLHTGDIGLLDSANRLVIIDRLKNIFKLSQGEYVAPEKIEGVYQKHELVAQSFVYGDSLQASLVGIVVPDKDVFNVWAKKNYPDEPNPHQSEEVKQAFLKILNAFGKQNDLKGFEQIRAIYLSNEEFSVNNDLLTPTFKLKREIAKKVYQAEIDDMYSSINNGRAFN